MAVFGFLAYALARDLDRPRQRFEVVFWTAVLIALVGFSRVFLGVHFLSDVASGFLVGGFWLLVGFTLVEWRRRYIRLEVRAAEFDTLPGKPTKRD
jgi:undecaprenyl-diphosphatase